MRALATLVPIGLLSACSDDPSVKIVAPLPDTTVVASVELRMEGHDLTNAETRIFLDLNRYSDLIGNTLPQECEDCMFVISFAGASITNGPHTIGVYMFDGETQLATDAISLVFAR
jgi:hypothetical protein